ncbi:MAG: hypothetical protein WCH40_02350 [Verrucomicrobiales bacterium]
MKFDRVADGVSLFVQCPPLDHFAVLELARHGSDLTYISVTMPLLKDD